MRLRIECPWTDLQRLHRRRRGKCVKVSDGIEGACNSSRPAQLEYPESRSQFLFFTHFSRLRGKVGHEGQRSARGARLASFDLAGVSYFFKIDLYEEPNVKDANGQPVGTRVLTIMLANEY